jgi:fatty-acid desaturase
MLNEQFINKEYYETFAGSDWPPYEKFISGDYTVSTDIRTEIENFVCNAEKEHNAVKKETWSQKKEIIVPLKFFITVALPGLIGLFGFFYLGGTFEKFLITTIICVYLQQFYQHTVHKWLTHQMFEPKWWFRPIMLWSTTIHNDHKIIEWVVSHKLHHRYSDTDKDPSLGRIGIYKGTVGLFLFPSFTSEEANFDVNKHLPWKDVQFVNKYQNLLYCLNFAAFCFIDLQIALLSLFVLRFYVKFYTAISNYIIHGSQKATATNLPWYWEIWFFGECMHKEHHDRPRKFDLSVPGRIEPSAKIWKYFVKNIKYQ